MLLLASDSVCSFASAGYQVGLVQQILDLLPLLPNKRLD